MNIDKINVKCFGRLPQDKRLEHIKVKEVKFLRGITRFQILKINFHGNRHPNKNEIISRRPNSVFIILVTNQFAKKFLHFIKKFKSQLMMFEFANSQMPASV